MHTFRFILQNICVLFLKAVFYLFSDVMVRSIDELRDFPPGRGVIFAPNHKSQIDVLLLPTILPLFSRFLPIYFLADEAPYYKKDIPWARYFYGGFIFWLLGGITFKKGLKNYARSLAQHEKFLSEGKSICIFPEGERIFNRELGEAHGGVGYLADTTGAMVVPVAISGTLGINWFDFFTFGTRIRANFGKPVTFAEFKFESTPEGYKNFAQELMREIDELREKENSKVISTPVITKISVPAPLPQKIPGSAISVEELL